MNIKVLWIAFVWPEPTSSAAGFRTRQLIDACRHAGFEVQVSSPCQRNDFQSRLEEQGTITKNFKPNDDSFDSYLREYQPQIVFFDRFIIEEQFGWRVKEQCPEALRILDTIDLHSLRRLRQLKVKQGVDPLVCTGADRNFEDTLREISAIYRCDLSLIISDAELQLLQEFYYVPKDLVALCRFGYPEPGMPDGFESRKNFVAIGNCNHAPNMDSYRFLKEDLWGKIRTGLNDNAELHIYGAYPTHELQKLDDEKSGFRIKGWTPDATAMLSEYRVNLAPLRFGAGIKGKICDGWYVGTPCVATRIAAEGMQEGLSFGGAIADDSASFAEKAIDLYHDEELWTQAQRDGTAIIRKLYSQEKNAASFIESIYSLLATFVALRQRNIVGAMLWHHQHRSTEFFSRWIEAKSKN